nr:carbamoyl phosphate synthase small subunit [Maliibacterium massiliense]
MAHKAYLVLQNGRVFTGERFGAQGEVTGEVVFTTAMTGYLETLSDPSYHGQIVVQTFPLIGNYGVIPEDFESGQMPLRAYIVRQWCAHPSNFRSQGDIDALLKKRGVIGLCGIDTRALTRIIREAGVMNGAIVSALPEDIDSYAAHLAQLPEEMDARAVSVKEVRTDAAIGQKRFRVALWDFGCKDSIRQCLRARGCEVVTVPAGATAAQVLALAPDGVMLSNGPGNPSIYPEIVSEIKKVAHTKVPMFGICLGHQLLALSQGAASRKLKYGHRGENQPARDCQSGRLYITSQNHGYAIDSASLPANARLAYVNANDGTCEGIVYTDMPAFSVQFHPEACAGPQDTVALFDRFIENMQKGGEEACR